MSAQQRSDPAVAREVIDSVFAGQPDGAKRGYLDFLAAGIKYLSRQPNPNWGITLLGSGVRLNVGWVECLVLKPKGLRVIVKKEMAPVGTTFTRIIRKWAPACRYTTVPLSEISRTLASLTESHHAALRVAGTRRSPKNIRDAHSTGVTRLLGLANPSDSAGSIENEGGGEVTQRHWTSYWKERTWAANVEYEPVGFSGGAFQKRGVAIGDIIYIISQHAGQLFLGGRMTVGRFATRNEAVRIRKENDLYDADEWVVAQQGSGTPFHQHRQLAPDVTKQLRFVSGRSDTAKALLFVDDRNLDRQTTRVVRELTMGSVSLLDEVIEMTDDQPRPGQPTIISEEHLREYRAGRALVAPLPEEIPSGATYVEGSVKRVLVNRYERDPGARETCIRHYGTTCAACGLDFIAAYGEVAAGIIHVHHLIPLSEVGPDYVVDPVADLRPVCPNCHTVIHHRAPPYSVEDVRQFIESRRSTGK